jgi:co-chaperonin GroES (HSP10)
LADKPQTTEEEIREGIGHAIDEIAVFHNQVLVGVYIRPEKTAGGVYLASQTRDEDKWQGKVGLVLKKGPIAFVDDQRNSFNNQNVEPGDWVMYRVSDAPAIQVNGVHCRLLEDIHIRGTVTDPTIIW